jgi:hypothetical protein
MKSQINPHIGKFIATVILPIFIQSCCNYYKVEDNRKVASTPNAVIQANPYRYFILRTGASAYYMNNIMLSQRGDSLTCMLDTLPAEHKLHLRNGRGGHMRYKKNQPEAVVLNEVHMYVQQDGAAVAGHNYTLALEKVKKIEVLEKDEGRTTVSYVLGGLGIASGVILSFLAINLAANPIHFGQ